MKNKVSTFIYLNRIYNFSKNIVNKDTIFINNKYIYVTTDLSSQSTTFVNGNKHTVLGKFSYELIESSKNDLTDIDLCHGNTNRYGLEISSIEQLRHFYITFKNIGDSEVELSFQQTPSIEFEFSIE